jgi:LPXTG-motif cell wall-anchored protein
MRNTTTDRRRAATGLAAMSAGAALLVVGLAGPASAHGKQEPEKPASPTDKSCLELADQYGITQDWTEYKVSDLPEDEVETDYTVDDRGTEDTADDFVITVKITNGKYVEWWSTEGIDAVYVNGSDDELGSYFYIYAHDADDAEETHDYHLGTPPWEKEDKNKIESVSFCYDDEFTPPTTVVPTTAPPETTTPSTAPPSTEAPTTTVVEETTTTTAPVASTAPSSTTPPTTETPTGGLPKTGSNTGLLVAVGAGLLAIGGALVASKRQIWRRFT